MLARAANPAERDTTNPAWADPEGQAAFERITADPRTEPARAPRPIRRRLVVGAGLAATAGAAAAVFGLPGADHGGAGAAWAVTKNADGSMTVSVKDFRDPAGLQAKLRAAGLRANVTTIPKSCAGGSRVGAISDGGTYSVAELAAFNGDLSTFTDGHTWQRLFAGSPSYVTDGPGTAVTIQIPDSVATAPLPAGIDLPDHISFTVNPNELPPGDTVNVGFPAGGSDAGKTMLVDVEKTGAHINCSRPTGLVPGPETTPGSAQ
jgi:hypothetical protein